MPVQVKKKKMSFISSISVWAPGQRSLTNSTYCEASALVPRSSRVPECRRCYHNILWNRSGSSPGMGGQEAQMCPRKPGVQDPVTTPPSPPPHGSLKGADRLHSAEGHLTQHRHGVTRWEEEQVSAMSAFSQCPFTHKIELTVAQTAVARTGKHTGKRPARNGPRGFVGEASGSEE